MALIRLVRDTAAPPSVVWSVVTDFAAYGQWMPLTRMRLDAGEPRVGWGFAGLSGVGPLSFADSMLVTAWQPPTRDAGQFRVVKTGWPLGGWAEVGVEPRGTGSRLVWRVDVVVRPLPFRRLHAPLLARASTWLYGRAVDAMVARAEEMRA